MRLMAWAMLGCAVGLAACQSNVNKANQPQFLTQKIYHAPAQTYSFDLGSPVLRGELDLKQVCTINGSSLDIRDQLQQQVRIDTINLNHNPQLNFQADAAFKDIATSILKRYEQQYQATAGALHGYTSHAGSTAVTRLTTAKQHIDIAIFTAYNYAYIVQFNSALTQNDEQKARLQLQNLLKSLQIPGKSIAKTDSTLPISFDLSNTDAKARQAWQNTYCS